MEITKKFILEGLERLDLCDLKGRPYDCSFELLSAPPERKRLIIMGFNGSQADECFTNKQAIIQGFDSPDFSNIKAGMEGAWGIKHLANRLYNIPEELGFRWYETVYTNALLMCSKDANSVKKAALSSPIGSLNNLIEKSMRFFEEVTLPLCQPELIIAYSNGMNSHSAARLMSDHFGKGCKPQYVNQSSYYSTFSFMARFKLSDVPVIGIRHMSRFKPDLQLIRKAWELQQL
ncbi:hypothetical protein [Rahnella perminowiae]|uniref:hypothetical protein n=1 Tax=Rahnella perminowiae TaxID=2816244 RepID=UPI001EE5C84E|nr:hypothetical protein [Rahnella perminowiae]